MSVGRCCDLRSVIHLARLDFLPADGRQALCTKESMEDVYVKGFLLQFQPWADGELREV